MANPSSAMSEEQIDELIANIKKCDVAQREIDMAKRAGIPIGDSEETLKATREQLMKIKNVYAPNRSIV